MLRECHVRRRNSLRQSRLARSTDREIDRDIKCAGRGEAKMSLLIPGRGNEYVSIDNDT